MGKQDNYLTLPDPKVKVATLQPHGLHSPWNSPGQNTGVESHSLLQGIFLIQGSNPGLSHCRRILYQLSHKGSPRLLEGVAYPFSRGSSQPKNQTGVSCIAVDSLATELSESEHAKSFHKPVRYLDMNANTVNIVYCNSSVFYFKNQSCHR